MSAPATALLSVRDLSVRFGGLIAVGEVTFDIGEGEIVSLIGPNGAGKTTTINAITGFVNPTAGSVRFAGGEIVGRRPEQVAAAGLVRTFQNAAMFGSMTVAENLAAGRFITQRTGVWQTLFRSPAFAREERDIGKHVDELVDLLGLGARRASTARDLPYGEQRVLGLGIALMAQPKLLVLDEPAAGLSPDEARAMGRLIRKLHGLGTTVLLIEHNMSLVMSISDRVIVLKQGRKLAEGAPEVVRKHPEVVEAYLGAEA
ncbi:ABC transporter ATP-binding protein [Bradyrhizobium erythrophlei]|jgi:branched-chain amino acid transport system ATP-binding protein|uniref:Amino acid/amide ABC transporter ATP-binding protein 1, HAAT family n=1 Tax=Bradyrhizobium erythrophlei TaxID=1437360 RepID=A0A1M7UPE7_9BRAD|nr:ABC transporter ATP-binding protein [Bradyrhizobium erythrophlei]SHN84830.1 amino acid/amide ABC transporter ATP-binding protein 1, HAAT family [Bradyrhizobium erythrophlei]